MLGQSQFYGGNRRFLTPTTTVFLVVTKLTDVKHKVEAEDFLVTRKIAAFARCSFFHPETDQKGLSSWSGDLATALAMDYSRQINRRQRSS